MFFTSFGSSGEYCDARKLTAVLLHPFPSSRAVLRAMSRTRLGCAPGWPYQGCAHGQQQRRQKTKCDSVGGHGRRCWGRDLAADLSTCSWQEFPRQKYKQGIQASRSEVKAFTRLDLEILTSSRVSTSWYQPVCPRRYPLTIKSEKNSSNKGS